MITTRSIRPEETQWFAALGDPNVHDSLAEAWHDGSSRPDWTLVAEDDGRPIARAALVAEPMGGGVTSLEGVAAFLWVDFEHPRHAETFRLLADGLAQRLEPHAPTTLDRRLNPEVHADIGRVRPLLEASGFELFQEKTGFAWTPDVRAPILLVIRLMRLSRVHRVHPRDP